MEFFEGRATLVVNIVFHMTEERFYGRVVYAIAFPRHGLYHLQRFDLPDVQWVCVVEPLVGVDDRCSWREYCAVVLKLLYGGKHEIHFQVSRHMPGHDLSGSDVLNHGKIRKAMVVRDIGDIRAEYRIGRVPGEYSVECVGKCSMRQ